MKNQKGITLIALIVTIIVLIILAGISVNLLLGQNGLIQRAKDAAAQQERAELVEGMKLAIANKQILTKGVLTQADIEEVLGEYGTVADGKVTTTKGGYEIAITDVYSGTVATPPTPVVTAEWEIDSNSTVSTLSIGALVKPKNLTGASSYLANEKFYVIGKDDTAGTVTLLAEKCVKTDDTTNENNNIQNPSSGSVNTLAFRADYKAGDANVYSASDIKVEVNRYVGKFITAGMNLQDVIIGPGTTAKGRLMWGTAESGEINNLLTNTSITNRTNIVFGPEGAKLNYWLGSPSTNATIYALVVRGNNGSIDQDMVMFDNSYRSSPSYSSLTV